MSLASHPSNIRVLPTIKSERRIGTGKIRFMNAHDIPNVERFVEQFGRARIERAFGDVDVVALWARSYVSVLLENPDEMIAVMVCNNYPNVPSVPQEAWEPWASNNYDVRFLHPHNTLWVHFFVFNTAMQCDLTEAFLKFVFKKFLRIQYVVFVLPRNVTFLNYLINVGAVVNPSPKSARDARNVQKLVLLLRANYTSSYKTRRALIEDNDEIVALIDRTCPRMTQMYGKHYIAAIVAEGDPKRQVIVADYQGTVVAAMIVTSQVNYQMLNTCYHLEIFDALMKVSPASTQRTLECVTNKSPDLTRVSFAQPNPESHILEFTLDACNLNEHNQTENLETTSMSDTDFDIEDIDIDMRSLQSSNSSSSTSIQPSRNISTESLFIGHLELNLSCVVLSYTTSEIEKFMRNRKTVSKSKENRKSKSSSFEGEGNSFAIEVMAVAKSHYFAINLLLLASYECYPEKSYCILSLPCSEPTPPVLTSFIRAHTRRDVTIPDELYLCHKLSVSGIFYAREAQAYDSDAVVSLLGIQKNSRATYMFATSMSDPHTTMRSYVFMCNKHIVGFAILDEEFDLDFIDTHYGSCEAPSNLTSLNVFRGRILHYTILPIFEKKSKYFLQELHRLSDYAILYYSFGFVPNKNVPAIIADMNLSTPMKVGEMRLPFKSSYCTDMPSTSNECALHSPAVFISTPLICARPRLEINTRIVVVGASDVGLSCVLGLLFEWTANRRHLLYNNLTIISAHGICRTNSIGVIPATSQITRTTLETHALNAYVDVVEGVMTAIDRSKKTITVSNNTINYDLLVLTCGLQFQMPKTSPELKKKRTENPENCFVINTEIDATICLNKMRKIWSQKQSSVIVYGHCLNVYSCITTLLQIGLPEKFLVYVDFIPQGESLSPGQSSIFADPSIEENMLRDMNAKGVRLYRGFLYNWEFDDMELIKSVTFQCETRRVTIECAAIFAYESKYVCQATLHAINACGLVFDGGLVITPEFRTNDPCIYAAGTCTKYPRRFYADEKVHKHYSQMEIGKALSKIIVARIMHKPHEDPFANFRCVARKRPSFVPEFNEPNFATCVLPGGINYFCVKKAGRVEVSTASEGQILITGKPNDLRKQGYFRLHLNVYGIIDEISCISFNTIETVNLTTVWGKHEMIFKKLFTRYRSGQITDFFEFFRGEEFAAIYHHGFPEFLLNCQQVLVTQPETHFTLSDTSIKTTRVEPSLINDIIQIYKSNNRQRFKNRHWKLIRALFRKSVYEETLTEMVISFLEERRTVLPMYAHPINIKILLGAYMDSEFFNPTKEPP